MYRLLLTTLGLATMVFAGSCVADNNVGSFVVMGNRSASPPECIADGSEQGAFQPLQYDLSTTLPNGVINLGLKAHPLVKSLLVDIDDQDDVLSPRASHVEIKATNSAPSEALVAALGELAVHDPPVGGGGIVEGGSAAWEIFLITQVMRDNLAANFPAIENFVQVEAHVTLTGNVSGNNVESDIWIVPITLYSPGLLIGIDGSCCNVVTATPVTCEPFQTGTRCCTHPAGGVICPSALPQTGCM